MINKDLSICLICGDFPPNQVGGQAIYTYELATRLAERGHRVKVITSPKQLASGGRLEFYFVNSQNPVIFSLLARMKFASVIKGVDILHGNDIYYSSFCFKRFTKVRIIGTSHNTYLQRMRAYKGLRKAIYPPLIFAEKMTYMNSDRVIAVSNTTKSALLDYAIPESKVDVIYNGVDVRKFSPQIESGFLRNRLKLSSSDQVILFVGRLVKRKNPNFVLTAARELVDQYPNIHCVFVGKGDLQSKLREQAIRCKIIDKVHFVGSIAYNDMPQIYKDADVFVLPSLGEGLPFTLLEAAASGLPLAATRDATGGTPIIQDRVNGFILDQPCKDGLASAIARCLQDKEELGSNSRRIAEQFFTWDRCVDSVLKTYEAA